MPVALNRWLAEHELIQSGLIVLCTCILALLSLLISRAIVGRAAAYLVRRTPSKWDDYLESRGVFNKLAWVAPAVVIYYSTSLFAHSAEPVILRLVYAYTILMVVLAFGSFLTAITDIYDASLLAKDVPIKGYIQVLRLIVYLSGTIILISILFDQSPWAFLSGIGAATAIVLLVFKDTILSLVASIQIASNGIIRVGDIIEMPKYDADGEVLDIALHTVTIQNGDLTITTVPTFKFIEESFKNWRGIQQAGARRIKRAVLIDQLCIRFLDEEMIARLSKIQLLAPYIHEKKSELDRDNRDKGIDPSSLINGRRMTNIGTLRAYLTSYLKNHPQIRQDMPCIVRQLAPGTNGLPVEIYAFVSETAWASYEVFQADIFDHVLAALPEFGLRVFQNPTGADAQGGAMPENKAEPTPGARA